MGKAWWFIAWMCLSVALAQNKTLSHIDGFRLVYPAAYVVSAGANQAQSFSFSQGNTTVYVRLLQTEDRSKLSLPGMLAFGLEETLYSCASEVFFCVAPIGIEASGKGYWISATRKRFAGNATVGRWQAYLLDLAPSPGNATALLLWSENQSALQNFVRSLSLTFLPAAG